MKIMSTNYVDKIPVKLEGECAIEFAIFDF